MNHVSATENLKVNLFCAEMTKIKIFSFHRFALYVEEGARREDTMYYSFNEWHHFVASFRGLELRERYSVYYDGTLQNTDYTSSDIRQTPGNGHVVVGKRWKNVDGFYTSVELDELVFFNRSLDELEIQALYQLTIDLRLCDNVRVIPHKN